MRVSAIVMCSVLLLCNSVSDSTIINYPAELEVRKTLLGKFKIFAKSKEFGFPDVVNRVSLIKTGVDGSEFRRGNALCPCGQDCAVEEIPLTADFALVGVWDKRLDNCEKAPRGRYVIDVWGPIEHNGEIISGAYGTAIITVN